MASCDDARWINGTKYIYGKWSYNRHCDKFHISLDSSKNTIGIRNHDFDTYNDSPEWGNWKLDKNYKGKDIMATTKVKPIAQTIKPPTVRRPRVIKPVTPKVKQLTNHVVFVLDASSSMGWLSHKVVSMYNAWISQLKKESKEKKQKTFISRVDFANNSKLVSANVPIEDAKLISNFNTCGSTALFDGVYEAVETVEPFENDKDTSMLIIVITDGDENNSTEAHKRGAGAMMLKKQKNDNWTFTYMLPPGTKNSFCRQYNVPTDNAMEWEASEHGAEIASQVTTRAISGYMTGRSNGLTSSQSFYSQTDMSAVKPKDVKSALVDIASQCQHFEVPKETDISSFVTLKTKKPYKAGTVFYQLTKREEVQPKKEVLIMIKGKPNVYSGAEARALVGLHPGATDYCTPGNHANYDIFVQSTSYNRKLVRGTKVIVKQ